MSTSGKCGWLSNIPRAYRLVLCCMMGSVAHVPICAFFMDHSVGNFWLETPRCTLSCGGAPTFIHRNGRVSGRSLFALYRATESRQARSFHATPPTWPEHPTKGTESEVGGYKYVVLILHRHWGGLKYSCSRTPNTASCAHRRQFRLFIQVLRPDGASPTGTTPFVLELMSGCSWPTVEISTGHSLRRQR